MSVHSCPNSKMLAALSPKLHSRTMPRQVHPHQSWEAATPRTKEMKAAELNDCLLMQFIHQPDLQIQVHPMLHLLNLGQEQNPPMRLILMLTHAALATILQSSNTHPNRWMFVLVMNPSNPSQMCQLCLGPLPGMTLLLTKHAFWFSMRLCIAVPNWITP